MTLEAHSQTDTTPNYAAIKAKQQATWDSGDYGRIGITLQITGEQLCETMDLHAGESVLDVAAGNGNASLAAARRFCKVISTDYVPALLEQSKQRAQVEGLAIEYQEADAEKLPFPDASFDNVVSTFGVMFAPNQSLVATELLRVCRTGGKIGLINWTPEGFIGQLFKTIGQYVAPPQGVCSPATWGTEAFINQHFGNQGSHIAIHSREFFFRYQSPQHWLDSFKTYYGPVLKTFQMLDDERGERLSEDMLNLIEKNNKAQDGTVVVPSEYFEVVVIKS